MEKCEFDVYENTGKLYCKTHNQPLLYFYPNVGRIICQVGEDEAITEYYEKKDSD